MPDLFKSPNTPKRPARSIKEIQRRRLSRHNLPWYDRLLYALLNGFFLALVGMMTDIGFTVIRSFFSTDGQIYWFFAPVMAAIGAMLGAFFGKHSGAKTTQMFPSSHDIDIDDIGASPLGSDVIRGIGIGLLAFAIIWLLVLLLL